MKRKLKYIIPIILVLLLITALILPAYWMVKLEKDRAQCRNNINQIKNSLSHYKHEYGDLPSNIKILADSKYCPMYPPNRFICPKNYKLDQSFYYAFTPNSIKISFRGKNCQIILFCRPEQKTGYFNAISDDFALLGGTLNNVEKDRLIKLYDTLIKDTPPEIIHFYTNPWEYMNWDHKKK